MIAAIAVVCFLFAGATSAANAVSPTSFYGFEGTWQGTGTFQGSPSTVDAKFSPILDGHGWALDVSVTAKRADGTTVRFLGRGQYVVKTGALTGGNWIDSGGSAYAIAPSFENGVLVVDWGKAAPVRGRSEYRLTANGELVIDDFAPDASGTQRRFATATLRRR
jgi:hypothetical protein